MKKFFQLIYKKLISTKTLIFLAVLYAIAMGVATFIENDFGISTARSLIYNSLWFELLMILLMVNLVGNIIRFKMYRRKKWVVFTFHVSFLIILLGAAVTRYISFEGLMPIREGETTDVFLSEKVYLKVEIDDGIDQIVPPVLKNLNLSAIDIPFLTDNHYKTSLSFKGKPVSIEILKYIPKANEIFIQNPNGEKYLKIIASTDSGREDIYINDGGTIIIGTKRFSFNNPIPNTINIFEKNDSLFYISPFEGNRMVMQTQEKHLLPKDSITPFHLASLYQIEEVSFVVPEKPFNGELQFKSGPVNSNALDLLQIKIKSGENEKIFNLTGGQYLSENPKIFQLNGLNFRVNFGSIHKKLPFQIKLRDFQLENYPGSDMPKSYASEVTVIDKDTSFDYRIYMNHILDYKGYRFYQSSYTITPQYEQTELSVNHDYWGTLITYIGYTLLYLGLILIFFVKGTRFHQLKKMLRKLQKERLSLVLLLVSFTFFNHLNTWGQKIDASKIDSIVIKTIVPKDKAEEFGRLVIQDYGGRLKPINTYSSELLRKLTKRDTYKVSSGEEFTADQVLTGMLSYPQGWWYVPLIYIKPQDEKLRNIIGIDTKQKYAALIDFFDEQGNYKLQSYIEEAQKKRIKSKFEQDVIDVSSRVNLLYNTLMYENMRLFPLPNDPNNKWYSWIHLEKYNFNEEDKNFALNAIPLWLKEMFKAKESGDYQFADQILKGIATFQQRFGAEVYPDKNKIKWEYFYNKHDAFRSLFWQYMILSLIIFIIAVIQIFNAKKWINLFYKFFYGISVLLFIWMTFFMGLRWYISGHAPWSNAYESMLYISFAIILFTLWFGRKSPLVLASGLFIGSMTLMIAHWNWMDPQIENLVPVLNSYWLNIHVSIIVASYGPFAIGMILGLISLFLMALTNEKNKKRLEHQIKKLTIINEMALTIGLVLLTIGNFLGGQWANESWGRYWGWDPKETWALISIVIYAIIIHARFVPGLKGKFAFNLMSVIGFASIIMTYFGVNFYLSGLHSYAKGEPQTTPAFIYYWIVFIVMLSSVAYYKYKKFYAKTGLK